MPPYFKTSVPSTTQWQEDEQVSSDEFFLKEKDLPQLYSLARRRYVHYSQRRKSFVGFQKKLKEGVFTITVVRPKSEAGSDIPSITTTISSTVGMTRKKPLRTLTLSIDEPHSVEEKILRTVRKQVEDPDLPVPLLIQFGKDFWFFGVDESGKDKLSPVQLPEGLSSAILSPTLTWHAREQFPGTIIDKLTSLREYTPTGKEPVVNPPVEQLSPKGLALLSAIYSLKDNNRADEPVVASTEPDFVSLAAMMCDATVGTQITVILQPTLITKQWASRFPSAHKTVVRLEKTETGLQAIHMDSTSCDTYSEYVLNALLEARLKSKTKPTLSFFKQLNAENPDISSRNRLLSRQMDEYQCGVFATKDARELNRDRQFMQGSFKKVSTEKEGVDICQYTIPPRYLKSIQSRTFSTQVLKEEGDVIVTRRGKTLRETHEKHLLEGYAEHFSGKYHYLVTEFVEKHSPEEVRKAVATYDAGSMTPERLRDVYGSKARAASMHTLGRKVPVTPQAKGKQEAQATPSQPAGAPKPAGVKVLQESTGPPVEATSRKKPTTTRK